MLTTFKSKFFRFSQTGDCFYIARSRHLIMVTANDLVVFEVFKLLVVYTSERIRRFWVVSAFVKEFHNVNWKKNHKSHISEIASKNWYLRVKKDFEEKLRDFRTLEKHSTKILLAFRRPKLARNISNITHRGHLDRLFRIFTTFVPFLRYLRVQRKLTGKSQNLAKTRS